MKRLPTFCGHPHEEPVIARLHPHERPRLHLPEWASRAVHVVEGIFCSADCAGARRIVHRYAEGDEVGL